MFRIPNLTQEPKCTTIRHKTTYLRSGDERVSTRWPQGRVSLVNFKSVLQIRHQTMPNLSPYRSRRHLRWINQVTPRKRVSQLMVLAQENA